MSQLHFDPHANADDEAEERPAAYQRLQWEAGEHRLERYTMDDWRRQLLEDMIENLGKELQKHVGQSFGLERLADVYSKADGWAQPLVHDLAPEDPWAWDLDVVLDAAFHRHARRARDFTP